MAHLTADLVSEPAQTELVAALAGVVVGCAVVRVVRHRAGDHRRAGGCLVRRVPPPRLLLAETSSTMDLHHKLSPFGSHSDHSHAPRACKN